MDKIASALKFFVAIPASGVGNAHANEEEKNIFWVTQTGNSLHLSLHIK